VRATCSAGGLNESTFSLKERAVEVYQIIFLLWGIVFVFWVAKQFKEHNKRNGRG
jgi:hypothetical protein